jgi:hypothetical protein
VLRASFRASKLKLLQSFETTQTNTQNSSSKVIEQDTTPATLNNQILEGKERNMAASTTVTNTSEQTNVNITFA